MNPISFFIKDSIVLYEDNEFLVPTGHDFLPDERMEVIVGQLDSLYKASGNIDYLSDKGLVLVLLKRYEEAISLFQQIERTNPGRYATAANMGTAYELMGDNAKALYWIKRGLAINPSSHYGSEWIHVNILTAKIEGEQLYTPEFLLKTNFGDDRVPVTRLGWQKLYEFRKQLFYQLNERVSFVKPKDKIVSVLMFNLAAADMVLGDNYYASTELHIAEKYGDTSRLLHVRSADADSLAFKGSNKDFIGLLVFVVTLTVLFVVGYVLFFTKNRLGIV